MKIIFFCILTKVSRAKQTTNSPATTKLWGMISQIKRRILDCLDSSNEGVSSHAYHFIESLALALSYPSTQIAV